MENGRNRLLKKCSRALTGEEVTELYGEIATKALQVENESPYAHIASKARHKAWATFEGVPGFVKPTTSLGVKSKALIEI